jgi:hypothetical protein
MSWIVEQNDKVTRLRVAQNCPKSPSKWIEKIIEVDTKMFKSLVYVKRVENHNKKRMLKIK